MLLYPFYVTPFARTFIIKDNANNGSNPPSCPLPTVLTPFPDITFLNEGATGCIIKEAKGAINEAAIGAIIEPQNPPCFFILCFTVSVAP